MMRIITGTARNIRLETLEGDTTRPTSERVKEAVFSMIQFDIEGRKVLDLFAGSGQLGLEALSRGAASATLCDADADAFEIIKRNAQKTKLFDRCRLLKNDYKPLLAGFAGKEKFDIIFLDPPYKSDMLADALKRIDYLGLLSDNGIVICENETPEPMTAEHYSLLRFAKYGRTCVTLLKKETSEN